MTTTAGRSSKRHPAAAIAAALLLCGPFLSLSFFESQANAATTNTNNQQLDLAAVGSTSRQTYFGTLIGKLSSPGGQVSGEVYAVDEQTLFIRNFNFDGQAPDAYFWSSTTASRPSGQDGFIVPDEKGSTKPLERYTSKDVVLRLPEGKTLREIPWLSIWSRQLKLSVGDIMIPRRELVIPRPLEIAPLSQLAHGLKSGPVTIVDAQTLLVSDFHYDGLGPDAYFWLTRGGVGLSASNSLKLKDENGLSAPLRKYQGETIVISLPDEFTVYDFDFFGVWCKQFSVNFGQTQLPANQQTPATRVPPSPKMLGIKPENKLNCEILYDDLGFEIRWVLDGDDIVMQLVGKIEPGEYMAFGLGKDDSKSDMNNADAVVAWVDRPSGQVHAADYFLGSKQQCVNDPKAGSCPDVKLANGSDSLTLLHGAIVNGYSMVTFKRPQLGVDELYDQHVYSDGQQSVIWAIGTLNKRQEIGYHRLRTRANMFIDFARNPQWNCPIPDLNASMHNNLPITSASQVDQTVVSSAATAAAASSDATETSAEIAPSNNRQQNENSPAVGVTASAMNLRGDQGAAWFIPQVVCPNDKTFYAQIGPTAGKKGYTAQTGRTSWVPPVSWYINGLLVPELVVERGQTYRFFVEGGNDKTSSSRRHPLYLTDSSEGGFNFKTDSERMRERIFGGVAMRAADGQFVPTAEGRLCEWKPTNATLADSDLYQTFSSYQRTLKLDCLPGQGALLKFAPDANTPDVIYYQCYTNRFMGWRIRVVDSCGAYISSQLNQLKQQQQQQQQLAAAGSNRISRSDVAPETRRERAKPNHRTRNKDTFARRESSLISDLIDLKAQASEGRVLSFEAPPPGFEAANQQLNQLQHQRRQHPLLSDGQEFAFMQAPNGGADFGDDFSASEAFQQSMAGQTTNSDGMLLLNNSFLSPSSQNNRFNLSTIEQILKLSPSDLEFLDDGQLDLVSAVALASASNPSQFLQNINQPLKDFSLPSATSSKQTQSSSNSTTGSKSLGVRMPKSLYSYMRRLASIYQPVQQQLVSMLSLQSAPPTVAPANLAQPQAPLSQQQHQQMIANLHQQIIAAAALVPATMGQPNKPQATAGEPSTSASTQTSSFSLASLVPKSKIDLSKSNLGKRFNKLRIKTGRKYEPTQQGTGSSGQAAKQQTQPPTPDNEFNYDIFNNQLMQLEERQKQYQNMESFAAALAAANTNMNWQMAPPLMQQHHPPHYHSQFGPSFSPNTSPEASDNLIFSSSFESQAAPPPPRHQQHFVEPLQQQQSTLSIFENTEAPQHRPRDQQAVFITKLPHHQGGAQQQQQLQQQMSASVEQPSTNNKWQHQDQVGTRYVQDNQMHHQKQHSSVPTLPSYLDSTDYNSIRQNSPASSQKQQVDSHQHSENSELLNSSDGTNHYLIRQQEPNEQPNGPSGESDHMLAIERYSKQSSERRPPSIVLPVTGEQVFAPESNSTRAKQYQPAQRFSSKLIDKHIVEPSSGGGEVVPTTNRQQHVIEMLETEQSAQAADLRRLNASEQEPLYSSATSQQTQSPPKQPQLTTTELPAVLLKPVSALDFFASDPPATTTMAYVTRSPVTHSSTVEPLVSSLAPSYNTQLAQSQAATGEDYNNGANTKSELVLKTNLIEPIKSTLVPTSSPPVQHYSQPQRPSFSLDTSPFTPIEFTNSIFNRQQQVIPSASNLLAFRLRPPALVESMLTQYRLPFRPEPPMQVASYLARQLVNGNQQQTGGQMATSTKTSQQNGSGSTGSPETSNNQSNGTNPSRSADTGLSNKPQANLIILKPALHSGQTASQTYALRPEYLTTSGSLQAQQQDEQAFRPLTMDGRKSFEELQQISSGGELLYGNELNEMSPSSASRRLAGHQFDRLSSLSSPPSTSMVLDPMQVSNSIQTYNFQLNNDQLHKRGHSTTAEMELQKSREQEGARLDVKLGATARVSQQASQQTPASQIKSSDLETSAATNRTESVSVPSADLAQLEFNILQRDNNTDNAILSHVMSLISSNAIPTPPLVPLASAYSSADYFLPAGDQASHLHHHRHHHSRRQTRSGRTLKRKLSR